MLVVGFQGLNQITVSADGLAPGGARPSADTVLTVKLDIVSSNDIIFKMTDMTSLFIVRLVIIFFSHNLMTHSTLIILSQTTTNEDVK